jgi:hypothetical protein
MGQIISIVEVLSNYMRSFVDVMSDRSLMNRSLLSSNLNIYKALKWFNIAFSFLLFIPVFASLLSFNLPNLLSYLIMAFLGYATWIFQGITGVPIFEEIRFMALLHFNLHSVFGMWLQFYDRFVLYDDLLHIHGGFIGAVAIFPLALGSSIAWSNLPEHAVKWKVWFSALSIVNMFGVFWEIFEFVSDRIFRNYSGYRMAQENSLNDTMLDLIYNNIGATIGILVIWWYLKNSRDVNAFIEKMGRTLGEFLETGRKKV